MTNEFIVLKPIIGIIFLLVYAGLVKYPHKRPQIVWSAIIFLFIVLVFYKAAFLKEGVFTAGVSLLGEFFSAISWNVLGIFVLVALVEKSGIVSDLAGIIQRLLGQNFFLTFLMIVWSSVLFSAFIDNVPYIMVMLPVMAELGEKLGGAASTECYVLSFGLLIGACLGGNCTPIGASANVVAIGLLKKQGYSVSFVEFARIGVPFTIAATFAGSLFVWLVWSDY